ncbi:hypothetical protein LEP1GSC040_0062 [Leptospira santarosai str. 2000030832]|nr:hypothetical protein LEP1GSC040_0062 [Leptospira santarosai str. 2000030832]
MKLSIQLIIAPFLNFGIRKHIPNFSQKPKWIYIMFNF